MPACATGDLDRSAPGQAAIQAVAPKGPTATPFVFEWRGRLGPADVYRVTVFDTAERQLLQRDTRSTRLDLTGEMRQFAGTTPRFLWRVAVVGENGEVFAQTGLIEFAVR